LATELRVNGKTYSLFKQLDGVNSKDTFAGEVRIIVTEAVNNNSPIKMGDLVEVFLDGFQRFTGYIEDIGDTLDAGSHDISLTARDTVCDLIDSFVPASVKSLEGISTFKELVQLCISGLNLNGKIGVIDNTDATFTNTNKIIAGETGQKVGAYLQENARVLQVFLNTDGKGNVLIQKTGTKLKTLLQNVLNATNNNIKKSTMKINNRERFHTYRIYSNSSLSTESATVNDLDNEGEAFDNEIRDTRLYEKIADNPMSSDQCKKAAEEEANIRRARSFNYSCEVVGFSANTELWEPNRLVSAIDSGKGLNGLFLINTVKWSSSDAGERSVISLTYPDKTEVKANPTAITDRTTQGSSTYGVQAGDTLSQIAIDNNITTSQLVSANPQITNPNLIFPDQQIKIPTGDL
jgi:prophage tail gpP-like protein